ncbi:glycosyltransferase family 4 protein [Microcoleus sp. FACHB-SPT15]|uniref:glycosyltransferase family 4 protein n=1 Tax=Microcoleus sp. FACHB-SPT15 TaxID=2692830 RepID=UPI0028C471B0|nr:glycosyltransferase family 4 protein [Microcoleus sp. FACHB-SPT15]
MGIELARHEAEYAWQAKVEGLPFKVVSVIENQQLEEVSSTQLLQRLYAVLSQLKPDVLVIAGYARPAMLATLLWSLGNQKPAILLSATKKDDAPRSWWSEMLKKWILKHYKAALVGGQPQKRYLIELGMPAEAIFLGYNVVGNESYHPKKIESLPLLVERPYFLTVNRFVPKKNLLFLISSYAAYRQEAGSNAWDLVLCGDGALRPQIEKYITELALQDFVHLPGFLQQDELLPYFAHAHCFIHASIQEQWGLVVNEAMAAGLPVLVSNRCGCFEDLVIEGINGFGFDPDNSQQLTDLMLKVSLGQIDLAKMSHAALEHIQKFSPDYFAQGLIQAVEYALAHR